MTDLFNDPENYTVVIVASVALLVAFLSAVCAVFRFLLWRDAAKISFWVSLAAATVAVCYTVLA